MPDSLSICNLKKEERIMVKSIKYIVVSILGLLAVWQLAVMTGNFNPALFPAPFKVGEAFGRLLTTGLRGSTSGVNLFGHMGAQHGQIPDRMFIAVVFRGDSGTAVWMVWRRICLCKSGDPAASSHSPCGVASVYRTVGWHWGCSCNHYYIHRRILSNFAFNRKCGKKC